MTNYNNELIATFKSYIPSFTDIYTKEADTMKSRNTFKVGFEWDEDDNFNSSLVGNLEATTAKYLREQLLDVLEVANVEEGISMYIDCKTILEEGMFYIDTAYEIVVR